MPWVVGIDEAGYGPNLGPLVMSSVAYRVDSEPVNTDLWRLLKRAVRRSCDDADDRLVVDDSKRVYSTTKGLGELERSVCAILFCRDGAITVATLSSLLSCVTGCADELSRECWFRGLLPLPAEASADSVLPAAADFVKATAAAGIGRLLVRCEIVCPRRFNECLDRWDSKAAVLSLGLAELLRFNRTTLADEEPIHFFVDKHGGRNQYSAMLQHAIDDGVVLASEEGSRRSVYHVHGAGRETTIVFQPEADGSHFCVALASMLCKYVREVLMKEFNAFWQEQVPGLKATAGYPGDSRRYFAEIRSTFDKLCVKADAIWRKR